MFAHKLLFELHEFVITDRSSYSFTHALHRRIVSHREGVIDLELFGRDDLYLPVTLTGVLHCAIFILEIKLLAAKDCLEVLDQCGLARVRCTVQPHEIFFGILSLNEYAVYGLYTFSVT